MKDLMQAIHQLMIFNNNRYEHEQIEIIRSTEKEN